MESPKNLEMAEEQHIGDLMSNFGEMYERQLAWAEIAFGPIDSWDEAIKKNTWERVKEEIQELEDAEDDIDTLDAIADIFVVCSLLLGSEVESVNAGRLANLQFKLMFDKGDYLAHVKKVLKGRSDFKAETLMGLWSLMADEYQKKGYQVFAALYEVTESNYSKFPTVNDLKKLHGEDKTTEEVINLESEWINENTKYENVVGKVSSVLKGDEEVVVFRCKDGKGKVVKPSTFIEPDLGKLVHG